MTVGMPVIIVSTIKIILIHGRRRGTGSVTITGAFAAGGVGATCTVQPVARAAKAITEAAYRRLCSLDTPLIGPSLWNNRNAES